MGVTLSRSMASAGRQPIRGLFRQIGVAPSALLNTGRAFARPHEILLQALPGHLQPRCRVNAPTRYFVGASESSHLNSQRRRRVRLFCELARIRGNAAPSVAGGAKVSEGPCGARNSLEASEQKALWPCRRSRHIGLTGPTKVSEGRPGASYSPETRGHWPLGHAPAVEGEDGVPGRPAASSGAAAARPPQPTYSQVKSFSPLKMASASATL